MRMLHADEALPLHARVVACSVLATATDELRRVSKFPVSRCSCALARRSLPTPPLACCASHQRTLSIRNTATAQREETTSESVTDSSHNTAEGTRGIIRSLHAGGVLRSFGK